MEHYRSHTRPGNCNVHDDWDEVHRQMIEVQEMNRIRKKSLAVSQPGDADEKEADEISRKVMSGESATIHGAGGTINRKGEEDAEVIPEFQSKLNANKGSGQSLPGELQQEMGDKMGANFSDVKVHTGSEAASMSNDINAKAFTHGNDIYFNEGQYDTQSKQGQELIAHELVHTRQQEENNIQPKIQRQGDYGPDTGDITPRATVKSNVEIEEAKFAKSLLSTKYQLSITEDATLTRLNASGKEKAAVYARGYDLGPATVTAKTSILDRVVVTDENDKKTYLSYLFTYMPPVDMGEKPRFSPYFLATIPESGSTKPTTAIPIANPASSDTVPSYLTIPPPTGVSSTELTTTYADYKKRLLGFFLSQTTGYTGYVNAGSETNPLYYFISFLNHGDSYTFFSGGYVFVGRTFPTGTPISSATQIRMSTGEFITDEAKTTASIASSKTIGTINGLADISSREERLRVNYYIKGFFDKGETDATINQIIPIGETKSVYYRLDFVPSGTNRINVTVTRIGDQDQVKKNDKGFDRRADIADINGYGTHNKTKADLVAWITKRYKNINSSELTGNTVEDVRTKMKTIILARAPDPTSEWFKKNYGINVGYEKTAAEIYYDAYVTGLTTPPSAAEQAAVKSRIKDFKIADQLLQLEGALHRLSDSTFSHLQQTSFIRESIFIEEDSSDLSLNEDADVRGFTRTNLGSGISVVSIYDSAFTSDDFSFLGGKVGTSIKVTSKSGGTMLHELGHVIGEKPDPAPDLNISIAGATYRQSFYDYTDHHNLNPITDYGREDSLEKVATPEKRSEFWADAFAIYQADKAWLRTNHRLIYDWFASRF